eukprot:6124140-Pleurochrysis_carterae.AAC.3
MSSCEERGRAGAPHHERARALSSREVTGGLRLRRLCFAAAAAVTCRTVCRVRRHVVRRARRRGRLAIAHVCCAVLQCCACVAWQAAQGSVRSDIGEQSSGASGTTCANIVICLFCQNHFVQAALTASFDLKEVLLSLDTKVHSA